MKTTTTAEIDQLMNQLETVRQSGATNMLDFNGVMQAANDQRQYALVVWLSEHTTREFGTLIMVTFSNWKEEQDAQI